jgi:endonuclease YncB( thermonuclease family)
VARGFRSLSDGIVAFAILALLGLIAAKLQDYGETRHAGAFRAADGDSLSLDGERMRLKGIDAPELSQSCTRDGKDWACGRSARESLQRLVLAAGTECSGHERDRYDRLLVVCRSGEGDLNGIMVRRGMAVSYGGYQREESMAKAEKVGLWAGSFEMPRDVRDEARQRHSPFDGVVRLIGQTVGWE